MRRLALAVSLCAAVTAARGADCTGKVRLALNAVNHEASVAFPNGIAAPSLQVNDEVTLVIGVTEIRSIVAAVDDIAGRKVVTLKSADALNPNLAAGDPPVFTSSSASLRTAGGNSVDLCFLTPVNQRSRSIHVGPAVANGGGSANAPNAGVIRLQLAESLVHVIAVRSDASLIPSERNAQVAMAVAIDTTDRQVSGQPFVDDNRVRAALYSPSFSFGPVVNRVRAGVQAEFARAVHDENRNTDVTVVLDGWLPFLQAANLISQTRTRTLPLSFSLSAGRRSQRVGGARANGNVAAGALSYHLYILDNYRVDLSYQTLFNDVSDRPAATPRTQHSYKAAVFYAPSADARFSAVASYENGHSGPVFTRLRQYFLGVGLQRLFGGSGQ